MEDNTPKNPRCDARASLWQVIKGAASRWLDDDGARCGAALAYYTVFSIAPLLLITLTVVGFVLGDQGAQHLISENLRGILGADKARVIESMMQSARASGTGVRASLIGFLAVLAGATAMVGELQSVLRRMWGTVPRKAGLWDAVLDRLLSAAFILAIGFLLLVSLAVSAGTAAAGRWLSSVIPFPETVMHAVNLMITIGFIAALFAGSFKYLPRAKMAWGDVWVGALATAFFFAVGNSLLGIYLGKVGPTSMYGAAGSLLALLLWTYYCAQILYFGAEFTRVYAERRGSGFVAGSAPSVR
jgi:membrane protein